ncbi:MAG: putative metal-binding motif-containing protein [Myxococcota bacterium]
MTSRSGRVLLTVLLLLAGCVVPSLEDLEKERERTCDADHPCLSDYACIGGICKKAGTVDCTPMQTRPCGEATGECTPGTETCTEAGAWGACQGAIGPVSEVCDGKDNDCDTQTDEDVVTPACPLDAGVCAGKRRLCTGGVLEPACGPSSYGPDFEASETRCDNLDNDCDGLTDEALPPQPCEKDAGVCAGATRVCTGGALPTCDDSTYSNHDPAYESLEASCDGRDNDCDGLTDSWAPRLVSDGGTPLRRKAAAVVMPGTGTAARRDILTLYEEGNRVVAKVLSASGAVGSPRYPSVTITSVQRATAPALGSNGVEVAEAWFEELSGPIYRLPVALAGPSGEAIANGSPGVLPVGSMPGPGQKVVVGLTAQRIILAYSHLDAPSAGTSSVVLASCPKQLDSPCTTRSLGAGRNPALLVEADTALVAYEKGAQLSLAKLAVPPAGTVTVSSDISFGGSSEHDAAFFGTLAALQLYSVVPGAPDTLWRRTGSCSATCDPTSFTSTPSLFTFSGSTVALTAAGSGSTRVLAWEDTQGGRRVARMLLNNQTMATAVSSPNETGRRPVVVLPGTAGFEVLYDTEGGSGATVDQVLSRRFCGP